MIKTILVADDNKENLKLISKALHDEGYKVRIAKDGLQTLESIKKSIPDLLILDVQMPNLDGYKVAEIIGKEQNYDNMPILFLSALSDKFNVLQAFQYGANDYVRKPFNLEELLYRVKNLLHYGEVLKENADLRKIVEDIHSKKV